MKRICQDLWEDIVAHVEGQANEAVANHLVQCEDCRKRADQLLQMFQAMELKQFSPFDSVIERAINLMPATVRRLSLLRTSLQFASARLANQDFQAVYGGEDLEIRVMYSKVENGWEVISRLPDSSWHVTRHLHGIQADPEGRFQFHAITLDDSQFILRTSDATIEIPSVGESIDGSNRPS